MPRRAIIPDLREGESAVDRFFHRDLEQLSDSEVIAEKFIVEHHLADLVFQRRPPRLVSWTDTALTDHGWLRDRRAKLLEECGRRGKRR